MLCCSPLCLSTTLLRVASRIFRIPKKRKPILRLAKLRSLMQKYKRLLAAAIVSVRVLKSIRVHLAAGSVEVKTVYITARSNAHVSNICGQAKHTRGVCTVGICALAYFRYCIPAAKRTPRTLLMRHTANFVSGLRRNSRSG